MASRDPKQQQQKQFLQIAEHDRFYSKLLSKETSLANPSFRVYYGRASVPFVWESQPGTPKRSSTSDPTAPLPPPLTPPPSYHSSSNPKRRNNSKKPSSLIRCLKRNGDNTAAASFASSLSSSSSSSGSHGSSFSSKAEDDADSADGGSPKSTLRAGGGCYSVLLLKNMLAFHRR